MRAWQKRLLATGAAVTAAAYAEFVLDIRTPHSGLAEASALAAVISFPSEHPDEKHLAGMYGLFVITPGDAAESLFPFSIVPGNTASSTYAPPIEQLRDRFGSVFPVKRAVPGDSHATVNSCEAPKPSEFGFGRFAAWLRLRSQTFCVVHWNGAPPSAMLISVTLADGDPWMRPFERWICRKITAAALARLAARPAYAACVLADRPGRMRPGDAQDTFASVVYEVRNGTLARMD